jgi:YVTN family beta-propeller protein
MRRVGTSIVALALCAAALLALPALAGARVAYFTGFGEGSYAAPVELSTGSVGELTPIPSELGLDVAIAPDGSTAYVAGTFDELVRIDVATNTEEPPIPATGEPGAIAIAPNGAHAYTANRFEESVAVFDLEAGTEVGAIPVGQRPAGIAVTPDGSRAYVANSEDGTVSVIDLASESVIDTIVVGNGPEGIAATPDGKQIFVVNVGDETVSRIDVATNAVTATIPIPVSGEEIAISPDGTHAYVLSETEGVAPIDLSTAMSGAAVPLAGFAEDIAILPDGSRAYITHEEEAGQTFVSELRPFDLMTNTFGAGFEVDENPEALAIVPNQPPHAAFSSSPGSPTAGDTVSFDGGGSTDPDGSVARYDWEFGDGGTAANAGPTPQHTYAKAGTYQVTLTVTDNEGCSTELVFTGQTAYCNGSSVARVTHPVTVSEAGSAPAPAPLCPTVKAKATSFHPKIRPGHVVPGVRVRLASGEPALLTVHAKLLWRQHGKARRTGLSKLSVKVNRWRRVRFPIPARLRNALPLGSRVRVRLRITTTPLHDPSCAATTTIKILHVRVVKVFPHAVQASSVR